MRYCDECKHAVFTGKYHKATLTDPEEFPEFDYCGFDDDYDIERYTRLFDYNKELGKTLVDPSLMAEYCPFYEERNEPIDEG